MEWCSSLSLPSSSPSTGYSILKGHCLLLPQGWLFCLINLWAAGQSVLGSLQKWRWLSLLLSLAAALSSTRQGAGAGTHPPYPGHPQSSPRFPASLEVSPSKGLLSHGWSLLHSWWSGVWYSFQMVVPLMPTKWCS